MNLSKRSLYIIIISIYTTTLLFANNVICSSLGFNGLEKYLVIVAPSILIISLLIDVYKSKKKITFSIPSLVIGGVFTLWGLITILLGINISVFGLKALIHLGIIIFLGILLFNIKIDKQDFEIIKTHIFISFAIAILIGLLEYIFNIGLTNKIDSMKYIGIKGRVISTYHIATVLDKYIIMILVILSYELLKHKNELLSILFILGSTVLALTFTRAGIIAYVALSITFIIISIIKKRYFNLLIVLITLSVMFLIPGYKYAFQSATDYVYEKLNIPSFLQIRIVSKEEVKKNDIPDISEDESITYRNYYEFVGTSIIKEYPITGIGLGNYPYLYNNQNVNDYLKKKIELPEKYMYPHNGYIQTTAELGILGVILYFMFFTSFIFKKIKKDKIMTYYPCILLIFFFFLGTYTEGLFTTKQYMYVFMIIYPLYCNYMLKKDKN